MTKHVAALAGISGVGKTTFLHRLAKTLNFQHLQASALIKDGRKTMERRNVPFDELRYSDIDENQQLLILGFRTEADSAASLVILDGHTLIERDDQNLLIAPPVFAAIGIGIMLLLVDDPQVIAARRANDPNRKRPLKSTEELRDVQELAERQAETICGALNVPLLVIRHSQLTEIEALLRSHTN